MIPLFDVLLLFGTLTMCGCRPRGETVVSYTTVPAPPGAPAPPLDVYSQIADNIADKISIPFISLFGFGNQTDSSTSTSTEPASKPWDVLDVLEDLELTSMRPEFVSLMFKMLKGNELTAVKPLTTTTPSKILAALSVNPPATSVKSTAASVKSTAAPVTTTVARVTSPASRGSTGTVWDEEENEEVEVSGEEEEEMGVWAPGAWLRLLQSGLTALHATWSSILTYFTPQDEPEQT